MSDFDKEAERRKLREKYERDQEKRKATQHMSELLLKGATMTNRHCDDCGDPIFRYDGQEFCPSCGTGQAAGGDADGAREATDADAEPAAGGDTEQAAGADAEPAADAGDGGAATADGDVRVRTPDEGAGTDAEDGAAAGTAGDRGAERSGDDGTQRAGEARGRSTQPREAVSPGSGDLSEARASLERAVAKYARAGESAEDPRRAKELFAAAREAAETLAALNR